MDMRLTMHEFLFSDDSVFIDNTCINCHSHVKYTLISLNCTYIAVCILYVGVVDYEDHGLQYVWAHVENGETITWPKCCKL
jgi:hypothetical protein